MGDQTRCAVRFGTGPGHDGGHQSAVARSTSVARVSSAFLVGDDEEVAGTASWVEHANLRHALAQVQQRARVVAGFIQLGPQFVEEKWTEHFQDVRDAGVVHPERTALVIVGHGLDHRAEDVRVDPGPVEIPDVEQIRARDLLKRGTSMLPEKRPPWTYGKSFDQRGSPAALRSSSVPLIARNKTLTTS